MSSPFIHLHTHSHYSLLQALPKIPEIVKRAKNEGMDAIALTDLGNLYGTIEFYKACQKAGIKPLIGVDIFVAVRTRFDKDAGIDNKRYNLVLLAENNIGYKNLIKIVSAAHMEGHYYKPRVDKDLLKKHAEGIICLSGTFSGEIARALRNNDWEKALAIAREHEALFGTGNYFLEILHHPEIEGHEETQKKIVELSKKTGIPLVATQDFFYLNPEDKKARDTLVAIQTSRDLADMNTGDTDLSFINEAQAKKYFDYAPEAIENTRAIADRCTVELELGTWTFPNLKISKETTYDDELRHAAREGIAKRGLKKTEELATRMEYELTVIRNKGYSPYFLVVADLLQHARENNIFTTIRGSVAGSLVTYLIGITHVNPLEFKLPFERFLNPERPSAPDIDMDYADNRRDEMLAYAREKYGEENVAQIGTFGTMLARGAVRDVARSLGYEYGVGDKIAKLIPMGSQGFPMTIDRALEMTPELVEMYKKDTEVKEIIDLAKKIEGCARHISIHAAGVVISPTNLTDFVPIQHDPKGGKKITQYDMHAVEDAGLLKFDFLGIRNLAILADAVRLAKLYHNVEIDIENIPLDDPKTLKMLARGETMSLFQLNGAGMTRYLKELRPTRIEDINAMVALYRPGPMESIPEYIRRKHNPATISYIDPRLKNILDQSYGVVTYQDDVMMIAIELAGYSWLEADKLRKAMGKKIPKEMAAQKEKLLQGFQEGGLSEEKAQKLWKLIEPFAAYGFNKAHAASYGRVAYQTAYMKANFPTEYMTAVLTAESGDVEKIAEIINECKRMELPVLPPDINESFGDFTTIKGGADDHDKIRFGLYTIKNLGYDISDAIIAERKQTGKFSSYTDFLDRVQHKNLNKKSLESLIKCGAFDTLEDRGRLASNVELALEYNRESSKTATNQESLFGAMSDGDGLPGLKLRDSEPIDPDEALRWEKELLGLHITGHPLDKHKAKFEKSGNSIKKAVAELQSGMETTLAGLIEDTRIIITKKGERMAFVKLADFTGSIEVVVFPRVFNEHKDLFEPDTCIALRGRLSNRNDELSVIAEVVKKL